MKKSEFEQTYNLKEGEFQLAIDTLNAKLEKGLEKYNLRKNESGLFRLKYDEARLKSVDSLFDKVNNDESLDFDKAFEPGHVRDLIGARFVCHNIIDVIKIGEAIKQGEWPGLEYRPRDPDEKKWLRSSHPDSGYRGWHLDVAWQAGGDEYFAELQVRTLLQDAWASFMHDDIYKSRAANVLPESIIQHLNRFSDMLHVIDQMANDLRKEMEDLRATGRSGLKILNALNHAMYALNEWAESGFEIPEYTSVYRKDRYDIEPSGDGTFTFTIHGDCSEPSYFTFPVWGDTHHSNATVQEIRIYEGDSWKTLNLQSDDIDIYNPSERSIIIKHIDKKREFHKYMLSIDWDGVFADELEYIFSPWNNLYRRASEIEHDIEIWFDEDLRSTEDVEPFLVDMDTMEDSIEELLYKARMDQHDGEELDRIFKDEKVVFSHNEENLNSNLLCLFNIL